MIMQGLHAVRCWALQCCRGVGHGLVGVRAEGMSEMCSWFAAGFKRGVQQASTK